jgi:Uma2 family endonuclease
MGEVEAAAMALPQADLAKAAEAEFATMERLWYELDWPEGVRIELIAGELIMSPSGSVSHSRTISELIDQVMDLVRHRNWELHTMLTAHIAQTRERLIPDLMVAARDAPEFSEWELVSSGVLLVAEVVSASSRRRDREAKWRAYAQGRIPLYLLIDRFADPPTVTIFSEPGDDGYRSRTSAGAGQPLRLPEPFDLVLDTRRLLG